MIENISMPKGMVDCFARYAEKTTVVDTVGESIASFCFGQHMWKASRDLRLPGFNMTREVYFYLYMLTDVQVMELRPHIFIIKCECQITFAMFQYLAK